MRCRLSLLFLAASLAAPVAHAEAAKKIAEVEVKIDDVLAKKDANIRTMYIVLYDADSKMPMPYGAVKVDLTKDAKGAFYHETLTTENVMAMGAGELPKHLRIKARLDKDGSAGQDEAGDLLGIADKVALGSKTTIKIDKAI